MMIDRSKPLGLIAGGNHLPVMVAREAKSNNRECYAATFSNTNPEIDNCATNAQQFAVGDLRQILDFFNAHDVSEVCLAGQINHSEIFKSEKFDDLMLEVIKHPDNRAESVLKRLASIIDRECKPVASLIDLLQNYVIRDRSLTERELSEREHQDLEFGWNLAVDLAQLNIGQTILVKNGVVIAVEAIEGTDEMIRRTSEYNIQQGCVIKVPMKHKDPRFDVPVIGPKTIDAMRSVDAITLVVASFETIILEMERTIEMAKEAKIAIVSRGLPW